MLNINIIMITLRNYGVDIWFPSHQEAENFGAKRTYIEILES